MALTCRVEEPSTASEADVMKPALSPGQGDRGGWVACLGTQLLGRSEFQAAQPICKPIRRPRRGSGASRRVFAATIDLVRSQPFFCALISLNLDSARSNFSLNSHIASRISRYVADVFALSDCPKLNMELLRR